jgi:hypothetical protein
MLPGLGTPAASALLPPLPGAATPAAAAAAASPAVPSSGLRSYSGPLLPGMSPMLPGATSSLGNRSGSDGDGLLISQQQFGGQGGLGGFSDGSGLLPAGVGPASMGEVDQEDENMDMP